MDKKNGGAAFPFSPSDESIVPYSYGMTLRDYFAAKAVEGMRFNNVDQSSAEERLQAFTLAAVCAYEIADAMLQERDK